MLGVSTGGRISELLSLTVGDVYQNQKPMTDLLFDKSIVKGGEISRAVPVNSDGRRAISDLIAWHREQYGNTHAHRPLFPSRNGQGNPKRMSRRTAHDVLKKAFVSAGLNGHLATHSLRKSFAQRLYDRTGDIFAVQEMLGHKDVVTTQKYLGVNYANVREAVEEMSLDSELHISPLLLEIPNIFCYTLPKLVDRISTATHSLRRVLSSPVERCERVSNGLSLVSHIESLSVSAVGSPFCIHTFAFIQRYYNLAHDFAAKGCLTPW